MLVLVTGATGKVGQAFLPRLLADARFPELRVRALCHNRTLPPQHRLECVHGSIADRETVARVLDGVTHVVHMATVKESLDEAMDVSVKGMFWLLEHFRQSPTARQFMLIGGDCSVGHIFLPYDAPITEAAPRRAYPGVYALSKILEEVMLEQYGIQYGLDGVTLRAPWIMEKDDFRYVLSFGDDQFGGPDWDTLIDPSERRRHAAAGKVPLMLDTGGRPLRRNFVHVDDLVSAMLAAIDNPKAAGQLFNIAMTDPVDYGDVADHLSSSRGLEAVEIETPFHSNALDNAKARHMLGWQPRYDFQQLIEAAFTYDRAPEDVRKVWYVG
ncbi:MAG TPA: NAD(P)-dependent oxidoreductase [Devosiaceae bacterium]|jgi:nucleoside-diphosphate-sugar epimerase|nr:NAD(P)-dependent oxidoreductase [Devosiaceae bacterium]